MGYITKKIAWTFVDTENRHLNPYPEFFRSNPTYVNFSSFNPKSVQIYPGSFFVVYYLIKQILNAFLFRLLKCKNPDFSWLYYATMLTHEQEHVLFVSPFLFRLLKRKNPDFWWLYYATMLSHEQEPVFWRTGVCRTLCKPQAV